jgi:hypothetical protein
MKNTRIRGRLHDHSSSTPDSWPATFGLPLVNDLVQDIGRHVGSFQVVANDTLYLLIGEGDGMLREQKGVHVCGQRCSRHGRLGLCEHFRPCAHVCLVDVLDDVFKAELDKRRRYEKTPTSERRTLIIALVTKL